MEDPFEVAELDRMSRLEYFVAAANALLQSKTYFVVYVAMIILSLVTVVWVSEANTMLVVRLWAI